jgi:NADH-quinone oxidoreductase subunit C
MTDVTKLKNTFPDVILNVEEYRGDVTVTLKRDGLLQVCTFLRDDPEYYFRFLADVTAVDYKDKTPRFVMVYHLLSLEHNRRLRLKVPLEDEKPEIETVTGIWATADWHERETYDMLGVSESPRSAAHPPALSLGLFSAPEGLSAGRQRRVVRILPTVRR